MTSFDEARAIVGESLSDPGLCVEPYGYEDADAFQVIVTELPLHIPIPDVVTLVSKIDGAVALSSYVRERARLERMTSIGAEIPAAE